MKVLSSLNTIFPETPKYKTPLSRETIEALPDLKYIGVLATGYYFDDTKRYIDALPITGEDRRKVFELNARRVYPALDASLRARGR
jgi:hypothetical protein